jgi:hypothetical protein
MLTFTRGAISIMSQIITINGRWIEKDVDGKGHSILTVLYWCPLEGLWKPWKDSCYLFSRRDSNWSPAKYKPEVLPIPHVVSCSVRTSISLKPSRTNFSMNLTQNFGRRNMSTEKWTISLLSFNFTFLIEVTHNYKHLDKNVCCHS